jgi:hypothetical protein
VKASQLAERIAGLGPVWERCRQLDAEANQTKPRPVMAGDTVRHDGREWHVIAIDSTHGKALLHGPNVNRWVCVDDVTVVR